MSQGVGPANRSLAADDRGPVATGIVAAEEPGFPVDGHGVFATGTSGRGTIYVAASVSGNAGVVKWSFHLRGISSVTRSSVWVWMAPLDGAESQRRYGPGMVADRASEVPRGR